MKKIIMTAVTVLMAMHVAAQQVTECLADSYTGSMVATIDTRKYVQPKEVCIGLEKGAAPQTVTMCLKNFILHEDYEDIAIGTITVPGIKVSENGTIAAELAGSAIIKIANGEGSSWALSKAGFTENTSTGEDQPFDDDWLGPYLGDAIPVTVTGSAWLNGIDIEVCMHIENTRAYNPSGRYYNVVMTFKAGEDVPTAINHVAESSCPAVAYTLDGRRAASGAKGIMIIDGKKVVK